MAERDEMVVVRRGLAELLSPEGTVAVILEAQKLARGHDLDPDDAAALLRGPLADALARRVGRNQAEAAIQHLESLLETARRGEGMFPDVTRDRASRAEGPLPVLVLASGRTFMRTIEERFGRFVKVSHATSAARVMRLGRRRAPGVVLIDAADFPSIEAARLAGALERHPPETTVVVWGTGLRYGAAIGEALAAAGVPVVGFDHRDGVEPVLDLLRSLTL